MKAIILAAGYATRLYPLTLDMPKPLLQVGDKKMAEHIMDKIEEVDAIDEVFVVTNNKFFEHFNTWSKKYDSSKKITVVNDGTMTNEDRLGAVGDIHFVIEHTNIQDDVLVVGGDNLFDFSLLGMVGQFNEKNASVIAVRDLGEKSLLAEKFGVIELNEYSRIIGFEEKPAEPKTSLASTCVYLFSKEDVEELENCIRDNNKPDNTGDFIRYLSEKKPAYGFVFDEAWYDIGSHEQLKEVRELFSKKE